MNWIVGDLGEDDEGCCAVLLPIIPTVGCWVAGDGTGEEMVSGSDGKGNGCG